MDLAGRSAIAAILVAPILLAHGTARSLEAASPERWLSGLAFPTNLALAADGRVFFTERETGNIRIAVDGRVLADPFAHVDVELTVNETGLLGIELDPGFPDAPWVYAYFTDATDGRNRLIRIRADGDRGTEREVLLDGLPATNGYHNGGDLVFGPDGSLYVAIGEGHDPGLAQDVSSIGGKVLRLAPDGSIPPDGPFGPDAAAYTIGHRNSFGLCVDPDTGEIWETENGPDRDDEINRLEPGGNYGWPDATGVTDSPGLIDPVLVFADTIALTGCAVVGGTLYFGSFGESLLRSLDIRDGGGADSRIVADIPGGITDVAAGPDGSLYVATADAIWLVTPPETVPSPGGDAGGSTPAWVPVVAAVVLAGGLILRMIAGRRLRSSRDADGSGGPDRS